MDQTGPEPHADHYLQPYLEAVRQHGAGFKATLWGSREAQLLRFEVMVALAGFDDCTILDIGCGQGDFASFLHDHRVPFRKYIGLDAVPEMIRAASDLSLDRCQFEVADVLDGGESLADRAADFACLSGTLNTMTDDAARWLVRTAFEASNQGVIFNFLSDRASAEWMSRDLHPARRFVTIEWVDWAMSLSPRVSFTQDYLEGHDATIMIRHE